MGLKNGTEHEIWIYINNYVYIDENELCDQVKNKVPILNIWQLIS